MSVAIPFNLLQMPLDSQFIVPDSFITLYVLPGRFRPTESREVIATRYEFCEDLAQMLCETARHKQWDLGLDEDTVLRRLQAGLCDGEQALPPAEAWWVLRRLVELLDWVPPNWLTSPDAGTAPVSGGG